MRCELLIGENESQFGEQGPIRNGQLQEQTDATDKLVGAWSSGRCTEDIPAFFLEWNFEPKSEDSASNEPRKDQPMEQDRVDLIYALRAAAGFFRHLCIKYARDEMPA